MLVTVRVTRCHHSGQFDLFVHALPRSDRLGYLVEQFGAGAAPVAQAIQELHRPLPRADRLSATASWG